MITIFTFAMPGHVVNAGDAQLLSMATTSPGTIDPPRPRHRPLKAASHPGLETTPSMITIFTFAIPGHVVNAGDAQLLSMATTSPGTIDTPPASTPASEGSVPPPGLETIPSMITIFTFAIPGHVVNAGGASPMS